MPVLEFNVFNLYVSNLFNAPMLNLDNVIARKARSFLLYGSPYAGWVWAHAQLCRGYSLIRCTSGMCLLSVQNVFISNIAFATKVKLLIAS